MNTTDSCSAKLNTPMSEEEWKKARELREKPFAEITTDQKIDRLVESIRGLQNGMRAIGSLSQRIAAVERHGHLDGKVVVDLNSSNGFANSPLCGTSMKDPLS